MLSGRRGNWPATDCAGLVAAAGLVGGGKWGPNRRVRFGGRLANGLFGGLGLADATSLGVDGCVVDEGMRPNSDVLILDVDTNLVAVGSLGRTDDSVMG